MTPRPLEIAVLAVLAGIIGYQLFVGPLVGLADNGDFARLLEPAGLASQPTEFFDRYFDYFNSRYAIGPWPDPRLTAYGSSSLLVVWLARAIHTTLLDGRVFDVRVLSTLYLLGALLGVHLILVSSRGLPWAWRTALAAAGLVLLTDPTYTANFNTFYSEPTALVCLLVVIGSSLCLIAGQTTSGFALLGYFLAGAVLVAAKPMFIPFAALLAPFGLYLTRFTAVRSRRLLGGTLAGGLLAVAVWSHVGTPTLLRVNTHYLAVFHVLFRDADAPEQELRDLGLKPEWRPYAGTSPYPQSSPAKNSAFAAEFGQRVTWLTVPRFFLLHPDRLREVASGVARDVSTTRVLYLGYYEKTTGKLPRAQPPAPWADLRQRLMPTSIWFFVAYFASGLVATGLALRPRVTESRRGLLLLYGLLTGLAAIVFWLPALVAAAFDTRYSILFAATFDVSLVLAIGAGLRWAMGKRRARGTA